MIAAGNVRIGQTVTDVEYTGVTLTVSAIMRGGAGTNLYSSDGQAIRHLSDDSMLWLEDTP